MKRYLGFLVILVFLALLFWGYKQRYKTTVVDVTKIQVTTSFYPMYFLGHEIGGDKANVINITPAGAEPHDYEPSTSDIQNIENSRILILNGSGLEPWGKKIGDIVGSRNILIVQAGQENANKMINEGQVMVQDPHIWLDPVLFKSEAKAVLDAFLKSDPSNSQYYKANAKKLDIKLDQLDSEFKVGLSNCKQKNIVTSHAAFGYLAGRYGFNQIAISGLSPDEEPTPKKMSEIANLVKTNNIKYIFFEDLVSPTLAQTLASETGTKTLNFSPLEGLTLDQINSGLNYVSVQQNNLKELKIALDCK